MGVLPYYMFNLNDERARRVGLIIQNLVDLDPGMNWKFDDNNMRFLRRKFALRDSLDYQLGFFAAMTYTVRLYKKLGDICNSFEYLLSKCDSIPLKERSEAMRLLRHTMAVMDIRGGQGLPEYSSEGQSQTPPSRMEERYEQMRRGEVKPRFRSDVPTERLKELRKKGYSYERIAQETGLSKSAVIYRLK